MWAGTSLAHTDRLVSPLQTTSSRSPHLLASTVALSLGVPQESFHTHTEGGLIH